MDFPPEILENYINHAKHWALNSDGRVEQWDDVIDVAQFQYWRLDP